MAAITFKPKQVTKRLLAVLPERARNVIVSRYGLGADSQRVTLEGIGALYGITRERVRQIENYSLEQIRKSEGYRKEQIVFTELEEVLHKLGGIVAEEDLLNYISKDAETQNHIHFLLVLGDVFKKEKEDMLFRHRWYVDSSLAKQVHESLKKLYENLSDDELVPESEMVDRFLSHLKDVADHYRNVEVAKRWLSLSKGLAKNPLGEWGMATSPNIRAKGMRDLAFLVIRRHGSPMHFKEVAEAISKLFNKRAHVATCHNELIKDDRFVLVGRGLYALKEWGYSSGVVRDVIKDILKKHGPLSREQIVEKVLKERYVKPNTIVVNLQNSSNFKRDKEGRYALS